MQVPDGKVILDLQAGLPEGVPLMVCCTENEAGWSLSPTRSGGDLRFRLPLPPESV
jgi:hypothetical protein